jgi:hypothetical protein
VSSLCAQGGPAGAHWQASFRLAAALQCAFTLRKRHIQQACSHLLLCACSLRHVYHYRISRTVQLCCCRRAALGWAHRLQVEE